VKDTNGGNGVCLLPAPSEEEMQDYFRRLLREIGLLDDDRRRARRP
jgi:hypothetical protein